MDKAFPASYFPSGPLLAPPSPDTQRLPLKVKVEHMCALRQPASPLAEKGVVFIISKAGKKSSRTTVQKEPRGDRAGGMESKSESQITQPGPQSYLPRWRSGVGGVITASSLGVSTAHLKHAREIPAVLPQL